jgi:hypothetical protein
MLHMPMKLSKRLVDEFNRDGRKLPNGDEYRADHIYIPKEVYDNAKDIVDLIKYTAALEYHINKDRLINENFLLVTFRNWSLDSGVSQGMTGWHIDGH